MPLHWLTHNGGPRPVPSDTLIHYRMASETSAHGARRAPMLASSISWRWRSTGARPTDIAAYAIAIAGTPGDWRAYTHGTGCPVPASALVQVILRGQNADQRIRELTGSARERFTPADHFTWTGDVRQPYQIMYYRVWLENSAPATITPEQQTILDALPDWAKPEYTNLITGHYQPPPWHSESWAPAPADPRFLHFTHLSTTVPGCVTYCLPPTAAATKPTRIPIKPGKYLQKYFSDTLGPEQIKAQAARVRGKQTDLNLTTDATAIVTIYQSVGQACMSHSVGHYRAAHYNGAKHPATAYANSPDLALAFTTKPGDPSAYTARAIVWPARKLYARAYGDSEAMIEALRAEGYTAAPLDGARLTASPLKEFLNHFTCPYIDHIKWARLEGSHLILQSVATGATHSVQHGDGIAYPISEAPKRPVHNYPGTIAEEHAALCALESGAPAPTPTPPPAQRINPPIFRYSASPQQRVSTYLQTPAQDGGEGDTDLNIAYREALRQENASREAAYQEAFGQAAAALSQQRVPQPFPNFLDGPAADAPNPPAPPTTY